jgi:hypothetical protein
MGLNYHDLDTRPQVYDIVWCKWPYREDKLRPGPVARCVLVVDVTLMTENGDGTQWIAVTAQYGTDKEKVPPSEYAGNLVIDYGYRDLGLHKPTVFKFDLGNRKRLAWCEEYFVPQGYVRSQGIVAGRLNTAQRVRFQDCFRERGLTFPCPPPTIIA